MIDKLQNILIEFDAHVLAYPVISNTELIRDEFISDAGNIYYSKLQARPSEIEFQIEFKGTPDVIRKNRSEVSKMLELSMITFDRDVFYKGRFTETSVDKMYYFEVVTYSGMAIAMMRTQYFEVKRNEVTVMHNNGNLRSPVRIKLQGNGSKIKITGFDSDIEVKNLKDELIIDSEKGISDSKGVNNVTLYAFPYIEDTAEISISGTGNFKCFIEFEGRVIC